MDNTDDSIDLLLINCSNLPFLPIFPYAFVQVGALARRRGLTVKTLDLVKLSEEQIQPTLGDFIDRFHPRTVGFTLRQLDSIIAGQYISAAHADDGPPPASSLNLFPLETTRDVILQIRSLTDAPVVVGGAGFSTSPVAISEYLGVDFGIRGEPDGLFDNFDAVLNGEDLASTPNLIYRSGKDYVETHRCFFEPFEGREYTNEVIQDIEEFYGKDALFSMDYPSSLPLPSTRPPVPVTISRGCPFHCCYCIEPKIYGAKVRHRSLEAIGEDIRFLASHGIRYLWLVCSELNLGTDEFALSVAEEITRINETLDENPIVWRSYHLPRWLPAEDLRLLHRSGFLGGWNDFPSWDDDNLAANQVPYKTEHILEHLRDVRTVETENGLEPDVFSVFLGNPNADAQSLSQTLRLYDDQGFAEYYGHLGFGFQATRVYECCVDQLPMRRDEITTVTRDGVTDTDLIHPSFHFSGSLYRRLGGIAEIAEFFDFLPHVVRSRRGLRDKDWGSFLSLSSSPEHFSRVLQELREGQLTSQPLDRESNEPGVAELISDIYKEPMPSPARDVLIPPPIHRGTEESQISVLVGNIIKDPTRSTVRQLFESPPNEKQALNTVCFVLLEAVYRHHHRSFEGVLRFLHLPADPQGLASLSTYRLMEQLYLQYSSTEELVKTVQRHFQFAADSLQMFLLNYLLYLYHVRIVPEYQELLFGSAKRQGEA